MAEDRGVEPHPISQNPVFKAGRRTNPAALSSITLVPNSEFESLTYRLSSKCSTAELIGNIWYQELDSNQPHLVLQTSALPDELPWHNIWGIV